LANNVTTNQDDEGVHTFPIADSDGSQWLDLPPKPAGAGHSINLSDGNITIQLDDIAFGDVYPCSGQSNTEMSVPSVFNASAEIEDSINYPNLRLATIDKTRASFRFASSAGRMVCLSFW
jgi:hypothetical protein